ncbi:vWA domain-containing protein [Chitinophaga rhizosphaerae]|uniref:vWA domain-containing protein n=1 Tax=Chitinophaga rhizosphaerae TaxID=1864947 RepID=UPI000F805882|nr:vWA domain-containing protein [Chitinophaga rhizosphaerae]
MKTPNYIVWKRGRNLLGLLLMLIFPSLVFSQYTVNIGSSQTINLPAVKVGDPIPPMSITIGVGGALGQVQWTIQDPTPPGLSGPDPGEFGFKKDGWKGKFPAEEGATTPATGVMSVEGTPLVAGAWEINIRVRDVDNPSPDIAVNSAQIKVIFEAVYPLDLVLVLDRSGSMTSKTSGEPTSPSRWQALKDAVSNFSNMYKEHAIPGSRLGIVYFHTDVSPVSPCCGVLKDVDAGLPAIVTGELATVNPADMTAIGLGMKEAVGKLNTPQRARGILLFTDGEQNIHPYVLTEGNGIEGQPPFPGGAGGIKIATIGIGSPAGEYHTVLMNLANNNRGKYNTTLNGIDYTAQPGGDDDGSLSMGSGFTQQFINMLSEFSPQLVTSSVKFVSSAGRTELAKFSLNKDVPKLVLEFTGNMHFSSTQLPYLRQLIEVKKNGLNIAQKARLSYVGNSTRNFLLVFDFGANEDTLTSGGDWEVAYFEPVIGVAATHVAANVPKSLRLGLNVVADDHYVDITSAFAPKTPRVKNQLKLTVNLTRLQIPLTGAIVKAAVIGPGDDVGDVLARNALIIKPNAADSTSPGVQKWEELMKDSAFRAQFKGNSNIVTLSHVADGKYEGTFDSLKVAGVYQIVYFVTAETPAMGKLERTFTEAVYVAFGDVDMAASNVATQIVNGTLVMTFRPITSYGRYLGPAMGNAFSVTNPNITIQSVVDHQDGSYTITFGGKIEEETKLVVAGHEIYTGKLENAGREPGSVMGLPQWLIWLLLLLVIIILFLLLRRKKK